MQPAELPLCLLDCCFAAPSPPAPQPPTPTPTLLSASSHCQTPATRQGRSTSCLPGWRMPLAGPTQAPLSSGLLLGECPADLPTKQTRLPFHPGDRQLPRSTLRQPRSLHSSHPNPSHAPAYPPVQHAAVRCRPAVAVGLRCAGQPALHLQQGLFVQSLGAHLGRLLLEPELPGGWWLALEAPGLKGPHGLKHPSRCRIAPCVVWQCSEAGVPQAAGTGSVLLSRACPQCPASPPSHACSGGIQRQDTRLPKVQRLEHALRVVDAHRGVRQRGAPSACAPATRLPSSALWHRAGQPPTLCPTLRQMHIL